MNNERLFKSWANTRGTWCKGWKEVRTEEGREDGGGKGGQHEKFSQGKRGGVKGGEGRES